MIILLVQNVMEKNKTIRDLTQDEFTVYLARCKTPQDIHNAYKERDSLRSGRIINARCFNLRLYLDESSIQRVITQNRRKIRSYAYINHDRDTDDKGELKKSHYHIVFRTYSQFTRFQIYKWFQKFTFDFDAESQEWIKRENIDIQITKDITASTEYLTHKNDPDKYQYSVNDVISDDWEDINNANDGKSKDESYEIVEKILEGVSERELLKTYGREYVYHRQQYRELAYQIRMSYIPEKQRFEEFDINSAGFEPSKKEYIPYTYTENYKF